MVDSSLNYAPDFVTNWIGVTAVWRPQIGRDKCTAVDFVQPLLQTKMMMTTIQRTRLSRYLVRGRPSWLSVGSSTASTFSSVCLHFSLPPPCLRSVLHASRSQYLALPLSSFIRKFSRHCVIVWHLNCTKKVSF